MINSYSSYKPLDFDQILDRLKYFCDNEITKNFIEYELKVTNNIELIKILNDQTNQAYNFLYLQQHDIDLSITNVENIVNNAKKLRTLSIDEILNTRIALSKSRACKNVLTNGEQINLLQNFSASIYTDIKLEKDIDKSFVSSTEVADTASMALKEIRLSILNLKNKIRNIIKKYTQDNSSEQILQDNIYTIRNNRCVLPVKSENRGQIKGILHSSSSSKSTVYIEPFEVVELNNELNLQLDLERAEIQVILNNFTRNISNISDQLLLNQEVIKQLDLIFSRAKLGYSLQANIVEVRNDGYFDIKKARHPLINKNDVVAIDVSLKLPSKILLITGSNTGGKTVTLKIIALFSLMASCGLMLPCSKDSTISVYDNVFYDIGDEQSINHSLSTFSSHMTNISNILKNCTKNSLIVLDELAMGTDPQEGSALAISIIKYLEKIQCTSIITTHYAELKAYALLSKNIQTASMAFDDETYKPTYKVLLNSLGSSNAIKIAKKLNLPEEIINIALEHYDVDYNNLDQAISKTEKLRSRLDVESEEINQIKKDLNFEKEELKRKVNLYNNKLEQLESKAQIYAKEYLSKYLAQAKKIVNDLKNIQHSENSSYFKATKLKKQLENINLDNDTVSSEYVKEDGDIDVGSFVYCKKLKKEAEVLKINIQKNNLEVLCNNMQLIIKIKDCIKIKKPAIKNESTTLKNHKSSNKIVLSSAVKNEIDIRGLDIVQAREEIDLYFSNISQLNYNTITIIHGKGSGVLRNFVHKYLKNSTIVKEYRLGRHGEGDSGVTIVTVK